MDESTWLDVAAGVDVQIMPPACDAAVDKRTVVPEVDHEDRLLVTPTLHGVVYLLALLGSSHVFEVRVASYRNIGEKPSESEAQIDHVADEGVRGDMM